MSAAARRRRGARGAVPRGARARRAVPWRRIGAWGAAALALGALGAGGAAALAWLRDPATLPVRHVRIEGELRHVDRAALERAAAPHARGGFLTVDLEALARAVAATPWVDRVSVRRRWPDTLVVQVREHRVVAAWAGGGAVNARGEHVDLPARALPAGLPVLAGPDGRTAELLAAWRRWQARLAPLGLRIERLEMSAREAWRLRLAGGIEVVLGRGEPEARLARLVRAWPAALAARAARIARVDLRYTNGFAVRWRAPERAEGAPARG
ncbi:MAG TPA: FtsQ-type POTRA domain-containing protein [Chromatiales bacterium]|nr:FtsQ-type POTRA domain-containing protein [Chromatiales bacterium]